MACSAAQNNGMKIKMYFYMLIFKLSPNYMTGTTSTNHMTGAANLWLMWLQGLVRF